MPAKRSDFDGWTSCREVQDLWPKVSGNSQNGVGEASVRRPTPVMWHDPEIIAFGDVQRWFSSRGNSHKHIAGFGQDEGEIGEKSAPARRPQWDAVRWTAEVKAAAIACGADQVAITQVNPDWIFEGYEAPQKWIVLLVVAMDFDELNDAPGIRSQNEVKKQYDRGTQVAIALSEWMAKHGWDGAPHGGPIAGPALMIPHAIEAGLGELGKHGSMINQEFGSSFRLANVLTDIPLVADGPVVFGADQFCQNCQLCTNVCPVEAIEPEKQLVRGEEKWYVDFDKCLPFFVEHNGCAMCLPACPWSRPGVAARLIQKMARRLDD